MMTVSMEALGSGQAGF